jgi:copper(I)-binding protein
MRKQKIQQSFIASLTFFGTLLLIPLSCNKAIEQPDIKIENTWSWPVEIKKATGKNDSGTSMNYTGAVYLIIKNEGSESDKLIAANTDICETTEIHRTKVENGIMKMMIAEDGIEIPAKSSIIFKTGGNHIMLIGLKESMEPGKQFEISFHFEKSGILTSLSQIRSY